MSRDVSRWTKPFPNLWMRIGAVGSTIAGLGFFLRWADGSYSTDYLMTWAAMTATALAVLAVGVVLARRSSSRSADGDPDIR